MLIFILYAVVIVVVKRLSSIGCLLLSDDNVIIKIKGCVGNDSGITFFLIQEEILRNMSPSNVANINDFLQEKGIPILIQNITQGSLMAVLTVLSTYSQLKDFQEHIYITIPQIFHEFISSSMEEERPIPLIHVDCVVEQLVSIDTGSKGISLQVYFSAHNLGSNLKASVNSASIWLAILLTINYFYQ